MNAIGVEPLIIEDSFIYDYSSAGGWNASSKDNGGGIYWQSSKTGCTSTPASATDVKIRRNHIVGPGESVDVKRAGIRTV